VKDHKVTSVNTAEVFYWDAPRRRLHPRNIYPIEIEINNKTYQTIEWSIGDFRIADFPMKMSVGSELSVKPSIHFRDFIIQFEATAKVLHYDADEKKLLARYTSIKDENKELLKYFSKALLTGDMVNIDNVLRRVDMPVTPATTELDKSEQPVEKTRFKRYLFSSLYLLLGSALLILTLLTLYASFFRLEVDSAVVSSPVTPVQASVKGYIKAVHVKVGDQVQQGDNLYRLTNTKLDERLLKAQEDFADKQQQVAMLQSLIVSKAKKLESYKRISSEKHRAALAKVEAETVRQMIAKSNLLRIKKLYAAGMISQTLLEEAEAKNAIAVNNLKLAKSQFGVTQESINALKNDYFFTGKELTGNIPETKAQLVRAVAEQELSKKALMLAEKKLDQLTITAPVSGEILNILTTAGQYAQDAQPLLTILETTDKRYIEAYLTQKEIKWIELGTLAMAYIPALSKELMVKVTRIDRTKGFYQEVDNRYNWRAPEDRSALVTLEFEDGELLNDIVIGLPVVLNFKKRDGFRQKLSKFVQLIGFNKLANTDKAKEDAVKEQSPFKEKFVESIKDSRESFLPEKGKIQGVTSSVKVVENSKNEECTYALWKPNNEYIKTIKLNKVTESWQNRVLNVANKVLEINPRPLRHIVSSGIDDPNNPELINSRKSLGDADNAAILSIAYQITANKKYLKQIKLILLAWAKRYIPSGHPINETRLEGMLWAYDSIRCQLDARDNKSINDWLLKIQKAKHNWKFGASSSRNNLRTHQLKILLMLDWLLADHESLKLDNELVKAHQKVNLLRSGQSFDYQERDALHYHTYNLEPWLEIALLDYSYKEVVNESYEWLIKQLIDNNIHGEFVHSQQKIDQRRAKKGFAYVQKGGDFDTTKAARSIIDHSSLNALPLLKQREYKFLPKTLNKQLLFHYARYFLWKD
jgi:multidrug resistance efflux pump